MACYGFGGGVVRAEQDVSHEGARCHCQHNPSVVRHEQKPTDQLSIKYYSRKTHMMKKL